MSNKTVVFYTVDDNGNEVAQFERLSEAKNAARQDGLSVRTRRV